MGAGKQTTASWSLSWHKSGETRSLQQGFAALHQFGIDLVHNASGEKIYGDVKQVEGAVLSPRRSGVLKGAETLCRRSGHEREGLCREYCTTGLIQRDPTVGEESSGCSKDFPASVWCWSITEQCCPRSSEEISAALGRLGRDGGH